jgi:hypothetical protein
VAVTAAGPQVGPPGYECNFLKIACLATLLLGASGPLPIDGFLKHSVEAGRPKSQCGAATRKYDKAKSSARNY